MCALWNTKEYERATAQMSTGVTKHPTSTYYLDDELVIHLASALPLKCTYPALTLYKLSKSCATNDGILAMHDGVNILYSTVSPALA